ncbi:putative ubiquitin-conjugating enzyme E2 [Gregarina niphandrodes]|uniref:Ubiquitin-conjugating enzyme E2 n=1 Tax=Gregarina niphandrodes TaxID=110365 RepID=A0A023B0N5_GRENI|nr:putative ubiquitin-conjugating enzyme E2 [Gregarina niphandrodes]EZG44712.1 putative ubiquitin-conjugating enzyme E2 [Gregarina niphandrodes]|eukprot:XP_011134132.1 putative ubiquitin-conjugating enzyme E2 [Gregarina niphandrodes]
MQNRAQGEKRLLREIQAIEEDSRHNPDPDVTAQLVHGDLRHWIGRIKGPVGTPYEGGYYFLDIAIPEEYPYVPPKMKFDTRVWHPNVSSQTGAICLDILKNEWSPALTIRTALLSVEALLAAPEPDDPQDAEVANLCKNHPEQHAAKARQWRDTYAADKNWPYEAKVKNLVDMGIPADRARAALQKQNWDVNAAANECFGDM